MRKNLSKTSPINVLNRTSLKYDIIFTLTTAECRPFIFGCVQKLNLSLTYLNAHLASIFSFFVFVFYDGLKLGSILQGKKDPVRRCDHGTKSFFAYFSLTPYFKTKKQCKTEFVCRCAAC